MRRVVPAVAAALLLAGPTVLAFYSGGFFSGARLVAAIVIWALVLAVAIAGPLPLPRRAPGAMALAGLALIAVWSAISLAWAPLGGVAIGNVQRLVLYVGALALAIGVLRSRGALRAVEPALAGGAAIVIGYGLAGRLLPGIVHLGHSKLAGGRLEQPITYWNSEGLLAAIGLVLCARLAGDRSRPPALRMLAAAAAAPLGAGVYLSYSRGAIAAAVVGMVILLAAVPVRAQLRAAAGVLAAAIVASACSSAFAGVASLSGTAGARERDGAIMLAILVVIAAAMALLAAREVSDERRGAVSDRRLPGARWGTAAAALAVGLVAAGLVVGGLQERESRTSPAYGAQAARLTSVSSKRYEYWRAGVKAFEAHPLDGLGSGGFRVWWLRERPIPEPVQEVHSLELEMLVELGIVGLLAFALMVAGVALAARRALRRDPGVAAGICAALVVWLLHASIDWDWQLPAVTLPAVILAGALIAISERAGEPSRRLAPAASEPWQRTAAAKSAGDGRAARDAVRHR